MTVAARKNGKLKSQPNNRIVLRSGALAITVAFPSDSHLTVFISDIGNGRGKGKSSPEAAPWWSTGWGWTEVGSSPEWDWPFCGGFCRERICQFVILTNRLAAVFAFKAANREMAFRKALKSSLCSSALSRRAAISPRISRRCCRTRLSGSFAIIGPPHPFSLRGPHRAILQTMSFRFLVRQNSLEFRKQIVVSRAQFHLLEPRI